MFYFHFENDYSDEIARKLADLATTDERKAILIDKKTFPTAGSRYMADIYIEKGLKALGWPKHTVVEVKSYLDQRNIGRQYKLFLQLIERKFEVGKFILIYRDTSFSTQPTLPDMDSRFSLMSYEEFMRIYEKHVSSHSTNDSTGNNTEQNGVSNLDVNKILDTSTSSRNENWKETRELLLEQLKSDLNEDSMSVFLGAGVSTSANMPSWGKLLESLLIEHQSGDRNDYFACDLDNILRSCGESYIIAARYIDFLIDIKTRAKIIQNILYKDTKESALIKSICQLIQKRQITQAITTNYDMLIEKELSAIGLEPFAVTENVIVPKTAFPVYHVHGSVNDPNNTSDKSPSAPVLSEKDYHTLYATGHHWSNIAILHALQHTHCIFIGLSMTDPNLRRLLECAHANNTTPHYIFMARRSLYEGYYDDDKRNIAHFRVQEQIMAALGMKVIWYELRSREADPHSELTELLQKLYESENETQSVNNEALS